MMREGATTAGDEIMEWRKGLREGGQDGAENEGGRTKRKGWLGCWNGGWQERRRIETRARRGEKGRVVREEGDIGTMGGSIGPLEKGNNRSGGGNKEIGRQQGREDKRGHMMQGRPQKSSKKIIEDHE
jgi:hypothetical protein